MEWGTHDFQQWVDIYFRKVFNITSSFVVLQHSLKSDNTCINCSAITSKKKKHVQNYSQNVKWPWLKNGKNKAKALNVFVRLLLFQHLLLHDCFFLWSWRTFISESVFLLVHYPPLPVWLVVLSAEHQVASTGNKNFSSGSLELLFLLLDSWNYASWEKYPQMVDFDSDHIKYLDNMAQALQCVTTQLAGVNDLSKGHFTILSNFLL